MHVKLEVYEKGGIVTFNITLKLGKLQLIIFFSLSLKTAEKNLANYL